HDDRNIQQPHLWPHTPLTKNRRQVYPLSAYPPAIQPLYCCITFGCATIRAADSSAFVPALRNRFCSLGPGPCGKLSTSFSSSQVNMMMTAMSFVTGAVSCPATPSPVSPDLPKTSSTRNVSAANGKSTSASSTKSSTKFP